MVILRGEVRLSEVKQTRLYSCVAKKSHEGMDYSYRSHEIQIGAFALPELVAAA